MRIRRMMCMATCGLVVVVFTGLVAWPQVTPQPSAHPDDAKLVKEFESRVAKYLDLRKKQAGSSPKPTASSAKLADTEKQIAANVQALRVNAKQGDIFTQEIADYFRRKIAATLAAPNGTRIRASLQHAEPVAMQLQVNQSYPHHVPLQSTPPTLLLNLPKLPKELEYRIVGHDLVLHDIVPNLVVDFVPRAVPTS